MWDWFTRYPSVRVEQIATPCVKGKTLENIASFDYIIVGGFPLSADLETNS